MNREPGQAHARVRWNRLARPVLGIVAGFVVLAVGPAWLRTVFLWIFPPGGSRKRIANVVEWLGWGYLALLVLTPLLVSTGLLLWRRGRRGA